MSAVAEDVGISIDGGELGLEIGRRFWGCIKTQKQTNKQTNKQKDLILRGKNKKIMLPRIKINRLDFCWVVLYWGMGKKERDMGGSRFYYPHELLNS